MISGVYIIKNSENSKFYIGSSQDIEGRWLNHLYELRKNKHHSIHLQRAYNKHGEDNFKFSILARCPIEYLVKLEQWFLDSMKPEYNILKNAWSVLGMKHSQETKERISKHFKGKPAWNRGIPMSEDSKIKLSTNRKGKGTNKRLKRWNLESRQKASDSKKGRKLSSTTKEKLSKKVIQMDINEKMIQEFNSITLASQITGYKIANISACCRGKAKSTGGFKWKFKDESNKM